MDQMICVTCGVRFTAKEGDVNDSCRLAEKEHREHFKGDWHRYNLKRRVIELPAITLEAFTEKVLQQKSKQKETEEYLGRCDLCNKTFGSSNAFENHIKSKKHRDLELKKNTVIEVKNSLMMEEKQDQQSKEKNDVPEEKMEEGQCSEEEWDGEGLGLEECLFCSKVSKTMDRNIAHMSQDHGFFIPDLEFVCDLEGLITYLGQLVGELYLCLWCKAQRFQNTQAVQQHMVDKGHCKMRHEGEDVVEYAEYYDYRKSYPDYAEGDEANSSETQDADEEVNPVVLDQSGYQLVLPSGSTVGHRVLMKYFRQKLRPERQVILHRDSSALSKVLAHYKALGWTGTTGAAAVKKVKDIAYVNRLQSRNYLHLGVKSNGLQKHFRDQVFGF